MQIDKNINSMIKLEKDLNQSAKNISKLTIGHNMSETKNNESLVNEMINQVGIPLSYSVNANVISVQNEIHDTIIDIKA